MTDGPTLRMKNPAHPGGFVRTEVIEPLELSVTEAAMALGVTRAALSAFLNQRSSLSPEMALRLEKAFGISMDTLMRMQNSYDIVQARRRAGEIIVAPFIRKGGEPSIVPFVDQKTTSYYMNNNAQLNNDHEVHREGCSWMPAAHNRRYLGEYTSCYAAVAEAKRFHRDANGCAHCSPARHTS